MSAGDRTLDRAGVFAVAPAAPAPVLSRAVAAIRDWWNAGRWRAAPAGRMSASWLREFEITSMKRL
jgi:hypothetical protein